MKEEKYMSFADDLCKKDYEWEDRRINQCVEAIKYACLYSKDIGKRSISGYFICEDGEGIYNISEDDWGNMSILAWQEGDYDYIKDGIVNKIIELGFSEYKVVHNIIDLSQNKDYVTIQELYKNRMKIKGHRFFIEIKW